MRTRGKERREKKGVPLGTFASNSKNNNSYIITIPLLFREEERRGEGEERRGRGRREGGGEERERENRK